MEENRKAQLLSYYMQIREAEKSLPNGRNQLAKAFSALFKEFAKTSQDCFFARHKDDLCKEASLISKGAEASLFLLLFESGQKIVAKIRFPKGYRHKEIDSMLRRQRAKREAKIVEKLNSHGFNVPKLIYLDSRNSAIFFSYLDGEKLSECLESLDYNKLSKKIGAFVFDIHKKGIIHADLTTSNMIYNKNSNELFFIDFGLSFYSEKEEDKAVDLHLLRQALESRHYKIYEQCFNIVKGAYPDAKALKRLEAVELRGRNKAKH